METVTIRAASRHIARLVAVLAALAACTPMPPRPPEASTAQPPLTGTLLAIRAIQPGSSRGSVLAALGAPGQTTADTVAVAEFIVAEDDGRTISVVQPDPGGLHAGLRVALLPGGQGLLGTRIAVVTASR